MAGITIVSERQSLAVVLSDYYMAYCKYIRIEFSILYIIDRFR